MKSGSSRNTEKKSPPKAKAVKGAPEKSAKKADPKPVPARSAKKASPPAKPATSSSAKKSPVPAKKKVAAAPARAHDKKSSPKTPKKATAVSKAKKVTAKATPSKTATKKAATPTKAVAVKTLTRKSIEKAGSSLMSKAKKIIVPKEAKSATGKKSAKSDETKSRSTHLKKLIALREERKKIGTRGKSDGLSSSTSAKPKRAKSTKAAAASAAPKTPPGPTPEQIAAQKKAARARKKAPYSKAELKELRAMLMEERESLLRDLRQLDDIAESGRQTTHATFSSHQADAASDAASLESTFIQRRYEEERFQAVSEALVKLEEGSYGLCDFCAEEQHSECGTCPFIPVDRLRAKPFARMCVQLRTKMEKRNRR